MQHSSKFVHLGFRVVHVCCFCDSWELVLPLWPLCWWGYICMYVIFGAKTTLNLDYCNVNLCYQITGVRAKSDAVNDSMCERREHIEELNRTCRLLRKIQVQAWDCMFVGCSSLSYMIISSLYHISQVLISWWCWMWSASILSFSAFWLRLWDISSIPTPAWV